MSKKLHNLNWVSVPLEGFPANDTKKFDGFVGLEECTSYGLDKEIKRTKKKKPQKKRKQDSIAEEVAPPAKKVKLSNGFVVESCNNSLKPSQTNEIGVNDKKTKKRKNKKKKNLNKNGNITELQNTTDIKNPNKIPQKTPKLLKTQNTPKLDKNKSKNSTTVKNKGKPKIGEVTDQKEHNLTAEDMLMWAEFKLQEPIMKALTELGFQKPTKIQQMTLPAAIHGRRDILGAAETGSGKTLAFGLPIISGILKLKEKAEAKGLDIYELPYKKVSMKKKDEQESKKVKERNLKKGKNKSKSQKEVKKEPSEDGYGTDDENRDEDKSSSDDDDETVIENNKIKNTTTSPLTNKPKHKKLKEINKKITGQNDDDFIEEYDVPIRKRGSSPDNDSDDSDSYIHLSEMLDSDDLAENSDDDNDSNDDNDDENASDDENNGSGDEIDVSGDEIDDSDDENEGSGDEDVNDDDEDVSDDEDEVSGDEDVSGDDNEGSGYEQDQGDEDVSLDDLSGDDDDGSGYEQDDETEAGIGCVKVIDDIEIPNQEIIKTGKPLYALILTPTRELAIQISNHLIAVAKYTGIRVATIVGGMAAVKQERVLRRAPEVVVATPGRLWDLIAQGEPHLAQLHSLKFLAIDETDRMIERGHFEELQPLLERLNMDIDKKQARQNFVFSATLTMVHDLPSHMKMKKVTKNGKILNRKIVKMTPQQKIKRLVDKIGMSDPKVVDITTQNAGPAENVTECRILCSKEHKDANLYYILKRHPGRTIVFCNSIGSVKRLTHILTILQCSPLPLHASMPQRQRLKNLERFRDTAHGLLVCTDVAARGLDVPRVQLVVHYQVPRTAENYVHRSGRTARAGELGISVLLVEPAEASVYSKILTTLGRTSEVPSFPVAGAILSRFQSILSLVQDIDVLELKRSRTAQALGWREKAAKDMDMIIDEDDVPVRKLDPAIARELKGKRRQLTAMLSRPVFPKGFSFKYPTLNDPTALDVSQDDALQVMKKAIESGEMKKEKRKSKNDPLLKLGKGMKRNKRK